MIHQTQERANAKRSSIEHLHARNIPEGERNGIRIVHNIVTDGDVRLANLQSMANGRATRIQPGTYTTLYRDGALWMSDTPDEQRDHWSAVWSARDLDATSVLINGLGIGMVVNAMLHLPCVKRVDVVEIDPDVVALVDPHYQRVAREQGKTLVVHTGDALTMRWPVGTRWDVAWHDIWLHACTDNLDDMKRLHRMYGRRVRWQGSWCRDQLQYEHRRERAWYRTWGTLR